MKHAFIELCIRDGDHEYYSTTVIKWSGNETLKNAAARQARCWYDEAESIKLAEGEYEFPTEGTIVNIHHTTRFISEAEYDILKHFI